MIVAAIVLFVLAVAVVGTTFAAAAGLLKRNTVAGIRVHWFLFSQEAWKAGHQGALLPVAVGGIIAVAGGLVCLFRPGSIGILIVTIILFVAVLAFGIIRGDHAARIIAEDQSSGS